MIGTLCKAALLMAIAAVSASYTAGVVTPPPGWLQFCADRPAECLVEGRYRGPITLTRQLWTELKAINRLVNDTVIPMTDQDHWSLVEHWDLADDGFGDCEDFVLLKRRLLMDAGWPSGALLVSIVLDERGLGHAVLTVRTHLGDLVLDNVSPWIVKWANSPYLPRKFQSPVDPNRWVRPEDLGIGVEAPPGPRLRSSATTAPPEGD